jgi:hypothetical protein
LAATYTEEEKAMFEAITPTQYRSDDAQALRDVSVRWWYVRFLTAAKGATAIGGKGGSRSRLRD